MRRKTDNIMSDLLKCVGRLQSSLYKVGIAEEEVDISNELKSLEEYLSSFIEHIKKLPKLLQLNSDGIDERQQVFIFEEKRKK